MKQIKRLAFLFFAGCAISASAQTWYFGSHAGISFSGGTTAPASGSALVANEGTSVLVDASNNVMMYSDGINVWNGNHVLQLTGLLGESSTTQAVQIVPIPSSSPKKAFVFTLSAAETCYGNDHAYAESGLRVSIATITGTAPATTITIAATEKNIRITDGYNLMSEKMAVTSDGRGGYWLVVHGIGAYSSNPYIGWGSGSYSAADETSFYAFNITCSTSTIPALAATKKNRTSLTPPFRHAGPGIIHQPVQTVAATFNSTGPAR